MCCKIQGTDQEPLKNTVYRPILAISVFSSETDFKHCSITQLINHSLVLLTALESP